MATWTFPWPYGLSGKSLTRGEDTRKRWYQHVAEIVTRDNPSRPIGRFALFITYVPPSDGRFDGDNVAKPVADALFLALGGDDSQVWRWTILRLPASTGAPHVCVTLLPFVHPEAP